MIIHRKISKIKFYDDGISKKGYHCIFISVILIDPVFKIGKNYYHKVFLEEYK